MVRQSHWTAPLLALLLGSVPACERGAEARARLAPEGAGEGAASAPAGSAATAVSDTVPTGTTFSVTLYQTLSARSWRVGDGFVATVAAPVRGNHGAMVIPEGAVVRGRLTQVSAAGVTGESALIRIAFESVVLAGRILPLAATVVEAEPQRRNVGRVAAAPDSAASVPTVAAPGRILPPADETGRAAGTAIALGTAAVEVVLPAGSALVIRLDAPVVAAGAPPRAQ